jgi:hypothetical protein
MAKSCKGGDPVPESLNVDLSAKEEKAERKISIPHYCWGLA